MGLHNITSFPSIDTFSPFTMEEFLAEHMAAYNF